MMSSMFSASLLLAAFTQLSSQDSSRGEHVADVFGEPVHVTTTDDRVLVSTIFRPVYKRFLKKNIEQLRPTAAERELAIQLLEANSGRLFDLLVEEHLQELDDLEEKLSAGKLNKTKREAAMSSARSLKSLLSPPTQAKMADHLLKSWKLQTFVYQQYGGGRIEVIQHGFHAVDAWRKFSESAVASGQVTLANNDIEARVRTFWESEERSKSLTSEQVEVADSLSLSWLEKRARNVEPN